MTETRETNPRLPATVYKMVNTIDGWIVGGAATETNPKDVDVMIPLARWPEAALLIPPDARPNTFGGWKWEEGGVSIDCWPDTLDRLAAMGAFKAALHPKSGTRLVRSAERSAWDRFQTEQATWAAETFPTSTAHTAIAHLASEVEELHLSPDPEEFADCMILLLQAAHLSGLSASQLLAECEKKHAKNKARKWGKPNAEGFVEHVEEGSAFKLPTMYQACPLRGQDHDLCDDPHFCGFCGELWDGTKDFCCEEAKEEG